MAVNGEVTLRTNYSSTPSSTGSGVAPADANEILADNTKTGLTTTYGSTTVAPGEAFIVLNFVPPSVSYVTVSGSKLNSGFN